MADELWHPNIPNMISVVSSVIVVENAATAIASFINPFEMPPTIRPKPKALKKAVAVVKLDLRARKIRLED